MKKSYQVFLGQTTMEIENVRKILSIFPSILSLDEEQFQSLAGPTRNIRAYVDVGSEYTMSQEQQDALHSLGLKINPNAFAAYFDPKELEEQRNKKREAEELAQSKRLDQAISDGARYFLCYFRQREEPWGNPTLEVSFVHPKSFTDAVASNTYAKELEQERYDKNDMNLQIEARLAQSIEDAKAGIFLDN